MSASKSLRRLRRKFLPTARERAYDRWVADRGDATLRLEYPLNSNSLVLDLGGFEGRWAQEIFARYGCRIEVFEPVQRYAQALVERFRSEPGIRVHDFGLGASSRTESIRICGDSSSVFGEAGEREEIRIVEAPGWFAEQTLAGVGLTVDLMKINIEGGEYELLERLLEADLVRQIRYLQIQFHDIAPDSAARMRRIQDALRATHRPAYQYTFVWDGWTRNL